MSRRCSNVRTNSLLLGPLDIIANVATERAHHTQFLLKKRKNHALLRLIHFDLNNKCVALHGHMETNKLSEGADACSTASGCENTCKPGQAAACQYSIFQRRRSLRTANARWPKRYRHKNTIDGRGRWRYANCSSDPKPSSIQSRRHCRFFGSGCRPLLQASSRTASCDELERHPVSYHIICGGRAV